MEILIRVDSSLVIGTGHVMRCLSLADILAKSGMTIRFVCRDLPGNIVSKIHASGYDVVTLAFDKSRHEDYQKYNTSDSYANWLGVSENEDAQDTIGVITQNPADLVIVDHYGINIEWEKTVGQVVGKVMVIDDLVSRPHHCHYFLDYNVSKKRAGDYDALLPEFCEKWLGNQYALIHPRLSQVKDHRSQRPKKDSIERILVFISGIDKNNDTESAVDQLLSSNLALCDIDLVLGKANPHKAKLKKKYLNRDNITIHVSPSYYYDLLKAADLAIGACGVAQMERQYIGLPSVVMSVAENQQAIYQEAIDDKLALTLSDLSSGDLISKLNQLRHSKVSVFSATLLQQAIPLTIRDVRDQDARIIYDWRSSPMVRERSLTTNNFSFESHCDWMKEKLSNTNCFFFMLEKEANPLGVIRFDSVDESDSWWISILVDPELLGRGYGQQLLTQGLAKIKQKCPGETRFVAEIVSGNIASEKLFMKSGFKLMKKVYVKE